MSEQEAEDKGIIDSFRENLTDILRMDCPDPLKCSLSGLRIVYMRDYSTDLLAVAAFPDCEYQCFDVNSERYLRKMDGALVLACAEYGYATPDITHVNSFDIE
jgi:hypothetical protein